MQRYAGFTLLAIMLMACSIQCNDPAPPSGPDGPGCLSSPSGVEAWWPGDRDSSDAISKVVPAVWGGVRLDSAKVQKGFEFDSTGGVIIVADGSTFDLQGSFTIMMWLKFRVPLADQPDYNGPGWDDYHFIVEKGDGSYTIRNYGLYLAKTTNMLYFNGIETGGTQYVFNVAVSNASTLFDDLRWHLVAVVWDQTSRMARVAIDGTTVGSVNGTGGTLMTNDLPLHIGAANPYKYYVDGTLDEIMFFRRALTNDEIQSMIAADATGFCR